VGEGAEVQGGEMHITFKRGQKKEWQHNIKCTITGSVHAVVNWLLARKVTFVG
jgi:hypothetical protein